MYREVFQGGLNFRYLNALINSKKLISDEIISRIAAGNRIIIV
jgi:peptidoglycan hydrolase CwlO-like protein